MASSIHDAWAELHQKQEVFKDGGSDNRHLIDSYFFIFDCIENTMLFTNSAFETVTGYKAFTFTVERLIEMIHPDDLEYFFKCEERNLCFTNKLSFSEHFQYVFHYTYRLVTASGDVITIQQQCQGIEVTNQGYLGKTLVVHKRVENQEMVPETDYKIFDKRTGAYVDESNYFNLTKREVEIVNLVRQGVPSTEIAKSLFISKLTVDTHRKKILAKTKCANFHELSKRMSVFEIL
jgi:DNA-binding CsgD family transcriptional regulator